MSDLPHRGIVDLEGARRAVFQSMQPVGNEHAGVVNALGKTLAEDLVSGVDVPANPTAATNGYAALASDTRGATAEHPRTLGILSESSSRKNLEPGMVTRVRAGEPLPEGADTIIASDRSYRPDSGPQVLALAESNAGENVNPAGSMIRASEVVLRRGARIGPAEMALIALIGRPGILISRKLRVAVITTGAKVVDIVDELEPDEVRNSARYMLVGMLIESGCDLGRLIHIREGRLALEKAIAGCANCDAVIVALSPRDKHDSAIQALANTGSVYFERVQVEPGAESAFGTIEGRPVFIISSEAVLEMFEAFIRPGLLMMLGRVEIDRPRIRASLSASLKPDPATRHYIRAVTSIEDGEWIAKPVAAYSSDARPWTVPNSLIIIAEHIDRVKRGEHVEVLLLDR